MNDTKVIPRESWKKFQEYFDKTEYEQLRADEIKKIFGKHLLVQLPKDVTERKSIDIWYLNMKALKRKQNPLVGIV